LRYSRQAEGRYPRDQTESSLKPGLELLAFPLVFLAIALWKSRNLFAHPRFWAEEATVFYARFLHSSFFDSIFYVKSASLQLLTNVIVYAAAQAPPELGPTVTTYAALALHLVVVVQIALFIRAHGLGQATGLLLVGAWALLPQTYEVWLSATNAQWVAGVSALMVFVMPSAWMARHRRGAALWCFVCGLSGVPATLLAPMFILRALIERSRPVALIAAALAATVIVQLAVLAAFGESRPYPRDPMTLTVPLFLQSVLAPVVSADGADRLAMHILSPHPAIAAMSLIATLILGLAVLGVATAAAATARRKPDAWLVLLALVGVTAVQNFGGISPREHLAGAAGARYFLCGAMCLCLLLGWGTQAWPASLRRVSFGLLCWIVLVGIVTAAVSPWTIPHTHGPSWRRQIDACVPGQICSVTVWPGGPAWALEIRK